MSSIPRWKSIISKAIAEHGESSRVIQLATVDASGYPRVRSHIFRSFLDHPTSPAIPLLLTSTDIRTPKATQIGGNSAVELVFWLAPSQEQLRIAGRALLFPDPVHHLPKGIDWEKKRREVFDSMSGHMKASWVRPVPGSPLSGGYEAAKAWPERLPSFGDPNASDEDKHNLEVAFGNFALVVIDPVEVDYVELRVIPNQRTRFRREGNAWVEEIVVP